jgi:hypothetical protein
MKVFVICITLFVFASCRSHDETERVVAAEVIEEPVVAKRPPEWRPLRGKIVSKGICAGWHRMVNRRSEPSHVTFLVVEYRRPNYVQPSQMMCIVEPSIWEKCEPGMLYLFEWPE